MTTPWLQPSWRLQGQLMGACDCTIACSCAWLRPPSLGRTRLLMAWHITSGHLNGLRLDNLNVAMACIAPGHRQNRSWQVVLYIDKRAEPEQRAALQQIFAGQHGGHPATLMHHVDNFNAIKHLRIDFVNNDMLTQLNIPGIAHAEIEGMKALNGKPSCISNQPVCAGNHHPSGVTLSKLLRYHDLNQHWEVCQSNGYCSPFVYQP